MAAAAAAVGTAEAAAAAVAAAMVAAAAAAAGERVVHAAAAGGVSTCMRWTSAANSPCAPTAACAGAAAASQPRIDQKAEEQGEAEGLRRFAYLHKVRRDAVLELERAQVGVDLLGVMVAQLRIALCEGV